MAIAAYILRDEVSSTNRLPIDQLAVDADCSVSELLYLVGRTERETDANIRRYRIEHNIPEREPVMSKYRTMLHRRKKVQHQIEHWFSGRSARSVYEAAGVTKSSYSQWKHGQSSPTDAQRKRLAEIAGVSLEVFMNMGEK